MTRTPRRNAPPAVPKTASRDTPPAKLTAWSTKRLLLAFVALTYALAWGAWIPAAVLSSGSGGPGLPAATSTLVILQTLGAAAPSISAYLVLRAAGRRDLIGWITRRYRLWRVRPRWYLIAAVLAPAITVAGLGIQYLAQPGFYIPSRSPLGEMLADLGVIGVAAEFPLLVCRQLPSSPLLEEFGWRGFALPALQTRCSAFMSSLILGAIWGLWHLPLIVAYRDPVLPYLLLIVLHTILFTWIVNNARGSMLIAMVFHAGLNTALTTMYTGSHSTAEIVVTCLVAALVVARSGRRNLGPARVVLPLGAGEEQPQQPDPLPDDRAVAPDVGDVRGGADGGDQGRRSLPGRTTPAS